RRAVVIPHGEYGGLAREGGVADRDAARAELGIPAGAPVTLMFGQLRTDKGLGDLIDAVRALPELHLLIGGQDNGGLAEQAQALADPALRGRVTIREGFLEMSDAAKLFAASDTVSLPYRVASASGVLLLAYGFRRPVVVYPVGGMGEAVLDGETGWICARPDRDALIDALADTIRVGAAECLRRGEAGERLADERYSWQAIAARTAEVYGEVVDDGWRQGRDPGGAPAARRGRAGGGRRAPGGAPRDATPGGPLASGPLRAAGHAQARAPGVRAGGRGAVDGRAPRRTGRRRRRAAAVPRAGRRVPPLPRLGGPRPLRDRALRALPRDDVRGRGAVSGGRPSPGLRRPPEPRRRQTARPRRERARDARADGGRRGVLRPARTRPPDPPRLAAAALGAVRPERRGDRCPARRRARGASARGHRPAGVRAAVQPLRRGSVRAARRPLRRRLRWPRVDRPARLPALAAVVGRGRLPALLSPPLRPRPRGERGGAATDRGRGRAVDPDRPALGLGGRRGLGGAGAPARADRAVRGALGRLPGRGRREPRRRLSGRRVRGDARGRRPSVLVLLAAWSHPSRRTSLLAGEARGHPGGR